MSDLGFAALSLALAVTTYSFFSLSLGLKRGEKRLVSRGRNGLHVTTALVTFAVLALLYSFVAHDFQIEYVGTHSNRHLCLPYSISAIWAGQEGVLLLWAWLLSILASLLVLRDRERQSPLLPYAALVMAGTQAFFLLLLVAVANPFRTLDYLASDGFGLNPHLLSPAMVWYLPVVVLGYASFTVPLALTLAVLISGRLKAPYVPLVRPWALVSWLSLGLGILLAARCTYVQLGMGEGGVWDLVENAPLLPWLTATALLHSFMFRGTRMRISHIALTLATFALCILGTEVTGSGTILARALSVPRSGPYFVGFVALILVLSVLLTFRRWSGLRRVKETSSLVSRRSVLLLTIALLVAATASTLAGELLPRIAETTDMAIAVDHVRLAIAVSVGTLVFLMGICPFTALRGDSLRAPARYLVIPFLSAVITGIVLVMLGLNNIRALLPFSVCALAAVATLLQSIRDLRSHGRASGGSAFAAFLSLLRRRRRRYGAYIIHLGMVSVALGIVASSTLGTEDRITLGPGSAHAIGRNIIRYDDFSFWPEPGMDVATASLTILQDDTEVEVLQPQQQFHHRTQHTQSIVAIHSTLLEDLYVVLSGWDQSTQTISFQVAVRPLIAWVWIGGVVLFAGTIIAIWPASSQDPVDQNIEEAIRRLRHLRGESPLEKRP